MRLEEAIPKSQLTETEDAWNEKMFQILCVKGTLRQSKVSLRSIITFQKSFLENIKKSDNILKVSAENFDYKESAK